MKTHKVGPRCSPREVKTVNRYVAGAAPSPVEAKKVCSAPRLSAWHVLMHASCVAAAGTDSCGRVDCGRRHQGRHPRPRQGLSDGPPPTIHLWCHSRTMWRTMRRTGQEDSGRQPPEGPLCQDASRRQEPCLVGQAPLIALLLVSGPTLLSWPCCHRLTARLHLSQVSRRDHPHRPRHELRHDQIRRRRG